MLWVKLQKYFCTWGKDAARKVLSETHLWLFVSKFLKRYKIGKVTPNLEIIYGNISIKS